MTRSLQLNPQHPVVAVLLGFIGSKLEEVRGELVRKSKEARKTEQARRLAQEADKIAEILNDDFRKISDRLNEIRAASSHRGAARAQFGAQTADLGTEGWVKGVQTPGFIVKPASKTPRPAPRAYSTQPHAECGRTWKARPCGR